VQRQAYFTLFEKEAHRLVNEGLTFDELCEAYLANLEEQFGDAVEVNPEFKWEWIAVPHFYHAPFYTYAYSFGQLLVLALFAQYKAEGESFIPPYIKILSYGGSKAPAEILAEAGLAVDSAEFWQGGYDVLKGMLRELELIQEKEHLL
jgi:oligoendopeptidase F